MNKRQIEEFTIKYNLNEVADFCYTHSAEEILDKYNFSQSHIYALLRNNGFSPTKEQIKIKKTNTVMNHYGVDNPAKVKEVQDKMKQTCLEKYGNENYRNMNKVKETKLKKYGDENYNNTEKNKQTCLDKYGVTSNLAIKEIHDKGTKASQSEEAKNRRKKTCLDKYGKECLYGSEYFKSKSKETLNEHYGVNNPAQSKKIYDKIDATKTERYGKSNYRNVDKISQTCLEKYGVPFYCMTDDCRNASNGYRSSSNENFAELLLSNKIDFTREFPIEKYSYDFKIGNILVEINPSYTHNSIFGFKGQKPVDKNYHYNKTQIANNNGYRVIHIFDWDDKHKIINILKKRETIYARNCIVKAVGTTEESEFLNNYHLQGFVKSDICYGLYYNDNLISLMSFGRPRYNKNYECELLRYCSSCYVSGGEEKLWKHFVKDYNPVNVISYCDVSKFEGAVYTKLGFVENRNELKPSKHWYNIKTKQHVTDNLLRQRGFDQLFGTNYGKGSSNEKLMIENGFVEIYDCGQKAYIWENTNHTIV